MFRSRAHSIVAYGLVAHAGPRAARRAKTNSMRGEPRFAIRSFLHPSRQNLCQTRDRLDFLPPRGPVGPRTWTGGARSWPSQRGVGLASRASSAGFLSLGSTEQDRGRRKDIYTALPPSSVSPTASQSPSRARVLVPSLLRLPRIFGRVILGAAPARAPLLICDQLSRITARGQNLRRRLGGSTDVIVLSLQSFNSTASTARLSFFPCLPFEPLAFDQPHACCPLTPHHASPAALAGQSASHECSPYIKRVRSARFQRQTSYHQPQHPRARPFRTQTRTRHRQLRGHPTLPPAALRARPARP